MPQPWPQPEFNTSLGLFEYANTVTSDWFVPLLLIVFTIVVFVVLNTKFVRNSDSIMAALFSTFVLGSFFWAAGTLAGVHMVTILALLIFAVFYSMFED